MTDLNKLGPYGEAPGSVTANLNKMSRAERARYWRNVRKHKADRDALELWAAAGFASDHDVPYGSIYLEEGETL